MDLNELSDLISLEALSDAAAAYERTEAEMDTAQEYCQTLALLSIAQSLIILIKQNDGRR